MILAILSSAFLALCVFAAMHDVNRLTIPNWLNLTLAGMFVPAAAAFQWRSLVDMLWQRAARS